MAEVIEVAFKQSRTVIDDLVQEIKASIYTRVGLVSVAEALGVLRVVESEILSEQAEASQ